MHQLFEQLHTEMASSLAGSSTRETQLVPPENPDKWNTQQIVEHLLLSYQSTADAIAQRVAKGTPTRAQPSLQQRFAQFTLITCGHFPSGREAPKAVTPGVPVLAADGADLTQRVRNELERVDQIATQAETLFGSARCVSHGDLGPLSIPQWRRFHLIHARHHRRQILALRQEWLVEG